MKKKSGKKLLIVAAIVLATVLLSVFTVYLLSNIKSARLNSMLSDVRDVFMPDSEQLNISSAEECIIVLDPGHGGEESPGAEYGDILERDVNLEISELLRTKLMEYGFTVIMTRNENVYSTTQERAKLANDAGAHIFISIHQNATENESDVTGIETWYNPDKRDKSKSLAKHIQAAVTAAVEPNDRGARASSDLIVTRETRMASCLLECGFMSNDDERKKLIDPAYQERLVDGIVRGVLEFLNKESSISL